MIKVGLILVLIAVCCQSAQADEVYRVPLFGQYAVRGCDPDNPTKEFGRYQLVEVFSDGSGNRCLFLVEHLKQVAVSGHMIVGTTDTGYFILDASQQFEQAQMFSEAGSWQRALKSAGIPTDIRLNDPDSLAATRPDREIRPMHYRKMHGLLGISDDSWAGLILLGGMMLIFMIGLRSRGRNLLLLAMLLGLAVDVVGWFVIGDGGPAAFVGIFVYPLVFYIIGLIGGALRRNVWDHFMRRRARLGLP